MRLVPSSLLIFYYLSIAAPVHAALNAESASDCVQQASEIESVTADSKIADPYDAATSPGMYDDFESLRSMWDDDHNILIDMFSVEGTKDIQSQRGTIDDDDDDGDEDNDGSDSNSDSDEDLPRFDTE